MNCSCMLEKFCFSWWITEPPQCFMVCWALMLPLWRPGLCSWQTCVHRSPSIATEGPIKRLAIKQWAVLQGVVNLKLCMSFLQEATFKLKWQLVIKVIKAKRQLQPSKPWSCISSDAQQNTNCRISALTAHTTEAHRKYVWRQGAVPAQTTMWLFNHTVRSNLGGNKRKQREKFKKIRKWQIAQKDTAILQPVESHQKM